jgi:hypothetical protein
MAKYVNPGDSIECNKSEVAVRKITKTPILVKVDEVRGRLYKYKSGIRAIVSITETLLDTDKHRINENSKVSFNDTLEGDTIEIYTKKRMTFGLISNFSHVHSIQGDKVPCFTYAKIIIPWRYVLETQNLLSVGVKLIK